MTMPDRSPTSVYQYPRYYAIGYQWNTRAECDFLETCAAKHGPASKKPLGKGPRIPHLRMLDIGCGAGRHLLEMARRGHAATGFDLRPEMADYVRAEAKKATLSVEASVGDLRRMRLTGTFDLAACLMDTFRFLLTNEEIIDHLREVAKHLRPGGLYVTDFWVPLKWDQLANEIYQWEQQEDGTTVKVFYLQHPESIDPVEQTFEDELVFVIEEGETTKEIRGERTRTRLLMPQEFRALAAASGTFDVVGQYADFDLEKPLEAGSTSWRMVSVLRKT